MNKVYLFFLFLIFSSCSSDTTNNESVIIPIQIGIGSLYGAGDENIIQQNVVITSQADWTALINQMDLVNNISSSFTEVNVDFANYQLLVVFDQVRATGGFSIQIDNVIETENTIEASVSMTSPGEVATMVITQPFHIVKIPITTKLVIFQ